MQWKFNNFKCVCTNWDGMNVLFIKFAAKTFSCICGYFLASLKFYPLRIWKRLRIFVGLSINWMVAEEVGFFWYGKEFVPRAGLPVSIREGIGWEPYKEQDYIMGRNRDSLISNAVYRTVARSTVCNDYIMTRCFDNQNTVD